MKKWSLQDVLMSMHDQVQDELARARRVLRHPGTMGDASQGVWIDLFNRYLPNRYVCGSVHVVDSTGKFSEQIDVAIYDRQYSPFILSFKGQHIIPAESVYAVFEAKQTINKALIGYARKKVSSVRCLKRTSLPIPPLLDPTDARKPGWIIGGILTLDSDWKNKLGKHFKQVLGPVGKPDSLEMGCIAAHGWFVRSQARTHFAVESVAVSKFILELIAQLQGVPTVAMIDVRAYAKWLELPVHQARSF